MNILEGGDLEQSSPFLSPMQVIEVYVSSQGTCSRDDAVVMLASVSLLPLRSSSGSILGCGNDYLCVEDASLSWGLGKRLITGPESRQKGGFCPGLSLWSPTGVILASWSIFSFSLWDK